MLGQRCWNADDADAFGNADLRGFFFPKYSLVVNRHIKMSLKSKIQL